MMKAISVCYLAILTVLLVVKNPLALVEGAPALGALSGALATIAHLASFALLGLLMKLARWPISDRVLFALLVAYGAVTESIQALLPWRTADIADFAQDLAGIAVGWAVWWLATRFAERVWPLRNR